MNCNTEYSEPSKPPNNTMVYIRAFAGSAPLALSRKATRSLSIPPVFDSSAR